MSEERLFLREPDYYKRDIDPIKHYIEQAAQYLSKMTGDGFEHCKQHIQLQLKSKIFPSINNPTVRFFERGENGDRSQQQIGLAQFIDNFNKQDLILAPTFTCYLPAKVKPSKLVKFVDNNKKRRSIAKKAAFKAEAAGDTATFLTQNNRQNNMKGYNNSLSGAFGSEGSVMYNPTAHNTLTSTIRSVSSFGNASNERVVMGNRHFYSEDIILYNLNCYTVEIDREEIQEALIRFKLHIPTVSEVMECIKYSSQLYISNSKVYERIQQYVEKMDDIERSAFCYIGDLYQLRILNDSFMRRFIEALALRINGIIDNPINRIYKIDEQILNYAHQIFYSDLQGKGKEYDKMSPELVSSLVLTSEHISQVIQDYDLFIRSFFMTKLVPASHAYIKAMMRRAVVLSDTDSTCFSVDDWMLWYFNEVNFCERNFAICGAVAFIANQAVSHILAILSANINVEQSKMHDLAMKNEFLWTVHMPTNVAKHYGAWTVVKEGNVYAKPKLEIKGVHMRNSAVAPELIKRAHDMLIEIFETVNSNQQISIMKYIDEIKSIEQTIIASVKKGEITYLKRNKIKDKESYTLPEDESPYQHYKLWLAVFQETYGRIEVPPFSTVSLPTTLNNKSMMKQWLDTMENRNIAESMQAYLVKLNKTALNTFYLSQSFVLANGIPKEIAEVVDVEKIALDLTLVFRIILESLGFFIKPDMLLSDYQ